MKNQLLMEAARIRWALRGFIFQHAVRMNRTIILLRTPPAS